MFVKSALSLGLGLALAAGLAAAPESGKPAPAFSVKAVDGKTYDLAKLKGKTVVLEWTNEGCPFVVKWYGEGNMQALQKKYTDKGVVWISINSGAKGMEGWLEDDAAGLDWFKEHKASSTALIRDTEGKIGKSYGAKTTPHMFVIDKNGVLAYQGAIDDKPSTRTKDIAKSKNWVAAALDALLAGKTPEVTETKPYGCRVKYAD